MSIDDALSKTQLASNKKAIAAPAFPGRTGAMGYVQGLTKLEWLTGMILSANANQAVVDAVAVAKLIIETCEKETK